MKKIICLVLALCACHEQAPPIADGTCVIQTYRDGKPRDRVCHYQGYSWSCTGNDCDNKGER